MVNLRNAFKFVIKSPFQSLIVLLAVFVSVGVQFFVLSLGSILDYMILDQTTSYQDHIVIRGLYNQNTYYNDLDFTIKESLKLNDSNIKHVNYFLNVEGDILMIDNQILTPSISLNFHSYDNYLNDDSYLDYTGLNLSKHLIANSEFVNTNNNEIMLDVNFAKTNSIDIGQTITYKQKSTGETYEFVIVGLYDLGIFRKQNNFTYISLDKFNNVASERYYLNVQLKDPQNTTTSLNKLKKYFENEHLNYLTWKEVIPEVSVLNDAQKIVILMIEVFISIAFFIVILSVLNYSVKQKYHQFGILKAIGQKSSDIRRTLVMQTFIIALIGVTLGLIVGTLGINQYGNAMTYPDGTKRFTVNLTLTNFLIPFVLTNLSATLASLFAYLKIRKLTIIALIKE